MPVRPTAPVLGAWTGTPVLLGVIVATGSTATTNASTAAPFAHTGDGLRGKVLLIQPDYDVYLAFGESASVSVTATTGVYMLLEDRLVVSMSARHGWIGAIPYDPAETANVRVFELV